MQNGNTDLDIIVLEPERARLTRVSRATWHRLEKSGEAPPRVKLSPRRIGWRRSDLINWLDSRRAA